LGKNLLISGGYSKSICVKSIVTSYEIRSVEPQADSDEYNEAKQRANETNREDATRPLHSSDNHKPTNENY
jgi:hypothetical protein